MRLVFGLYFYFLMPLIWLFLRVSRPWLPKKIQTMIAERQQPFPKAVLKPIWIHASSGEIEYAKPIIALLKKKNPQIKILLSYFSPSIHPLIKDLDVDQIVPLPFDLPWKARSFMDHFQPQVGLFARSDVWPGMARRARRHKVPLILFSASISAKSSRLKGLTKILFRFSLSQLAKISCVSAEDEQILRDLTTGISLPGGVVNEGDTRFDQVLFRAREKSRLAVNLSDSVITLGSTWPQDEAALFPDLIQVAERIQIVIAPHEPSIERITKIEHYFLQAGLSVIRHSKITANENLFQKNVILVDQVGVLFDYYKLSKMAFVGGSFRQKVHSVMEPLACGLPVFVGPLINNNREALTFRNLKIFDHAIVQTPDLPFLKWIEFWSVQAEAAKKDILDRVCDQMGSSAKIVSWVNENLKT